MRVKRKVSDALRDFEVYRTEQKVRIEHMFSALDIAIAELRIDKLPASMHRCVVMRDELRKRDMAIERILLGLAEKQRADSALTMTDDMLFEAMEAIDAVEAILSCKKDLYVLVPRERKQKARLLRAQGHSIAHQALLDDMLARVRTDTVQCATMELVTRLHEIALTVPGLGRGYGRKNFDDYAIAMKNIGKFIRFVKKTHEVYCRVYSR